MGYRRRFAGGSRLFRLACRGGACRTDDAPYSAVVQSTKSRLAGQSGERVTEVRFKSVKSSRSSASSVSLRLPAEENILSS